LTGEGVRRRALRGAFALTHRREDRRDEEADREAHSDVEDDHDG
jgi:hypothetical protein